MPELIPLSPINPPLQALQWQRRYFRRHMRPLKRAVDAGTATPDDRQDYLAMSDLLNKIDAQIEDVISEAEAA